jgi:hypothetical protein
MWTTFLSGWIKPKPTPTPTPSPSDPFTTDKIHFTQADEQTNIFSANARVLYKLT